MINLLLAIVVSASIDSTMLMLGDQTDLHLSVTHEVSEQVQMPVYGEMLQEGIEIVDRSAIDTTALPDGRVQMTQDLTLTSFKDSLFAIQPLYVTSGEDTFWTEPMALNVIQPFEVDSSLAITDIKDIEKALMTSDLGITPSNDGAIIRLVFPELTEERRKQLAKDIKKKGEDAKVAVRNVRRDGNDALKKLKGSEVSEDEINDLND